MVDYESYTYRWYEIISVILIGIITCIIFSYLFYDNLLNTKNGGKLRIKSFAVIDGNHLFLHIELKRSLQTDMVGCII